MKRIVIMLVASTSITHFAAAQTHFINAVIIDKKGDSIFGRIDYRNWRNNPQSIVFVRQDNEKQRLDTSQIKGFFIPSYHESYVSATLSLDLLPRDQDEAIKNNVIDSATVTRSLFLLQVIKHPVASLYEYSVDNKDHYFYGDRMNGPVELIHHFVNEDPAGKLVENDSYKEQLSVYFASCPEVLRKVQDIKFSRSDLQSIVLEYINCKAPGSKADVKAKEPLYFKFRVLAGAMVNSFRFVGSETSLVSSNYNGNTSPVFGLVADLGISRERHKWHIVNELIYKSYKATGNFTKPFGAGYTVTSNVRLQFAYMQLNSLLRYVFQTVGSVQPFINAGIGNAFMLAEKENSIHNSYSFGREEDLKAIDGPARYEFTIQAGAGVAFGHFTAEFRYGGFSKKGFSSYQTLDVNPSSISGMVSYHF